MVNKESLISIIIPNYNTAHYLEQAVDSVKRSNYQHWEIIIIDDESKDNSKEVIEYLATQDSRIKFVFQKNKGLAGARNTGIKASKGDYLVFLDSDDLVLEQKLFLQANFLDNNPNIDIVYSYSDCFREDDVNSRFNLGFPIYEGNILANLINGNFIHVNCVMVRSVKVKQVGMFNENYRELEDWDLWLRMSLSGSKFGVIKQVLSIVRVRKGSMTNNQKRMNQTMVNVLLNLEESFKALNIKEIYLEYNLSVLRFMIIAADRRFYKKWIKNLNSLQPKYIFAMFKLVIKKLLWSEKKVSDSVKQLEKIWNEQ